MRRRRVEKADHPGEPRAWLLVDQPHVLRPCRGERARDVRGRIAEVMQTLAAFGEELADAARRRERLEELDLAVADGEERRPYALILDGRDLVHRQSQAVAPKAVRLLEVTDDDTDVVNAGERGAHGSVVTDRESAAQSRAVRSAAS